MSNGSKTRRGCGGVTRGNTETRIRKSTANLPFRMSRQMRPSLSGRNRMRRRDETKVTISLTDVRVVDLGEEPDLWWAHRILFWQKKFQPKDAI